MIAQFSIPVFPVPLSACFVNVKRNGRADSMRYKEFKRVVDTDPARNQSAVLGTPYRATFAGDVMVDYAVLRPDRRNRDLDNLLKALNDTLTRNHIVHDDSQIVDLRIHWADCVPSGHVIATIAEAP